MPSKWGKIQGLTLLFFRIALTLNNSITIDLPSSSGSSSLTSASSSISGDSSSSSDHTLDPAYSSIDALNYSRSFSFVYQSKFPSASSSSSDSSMESSSPSSSLVTDSFSSSESTLLSSPTSSSDGEDFSSLFSDGGFSFVGLFAEDPSSNLYFSVLLGNTFLPAWVFSIFMQANIEEDHVNITLPVSFKDAYKALVGEGKFETVTVSLNQE